jgi:hypothetical protein
VRLTLCLLLGLAAAWPWAAPATQRRDLPPGADPDWLAYRNERYAFRLWYPPAGRVETHREHGLQRITIASAQAEPDGYHVDVLIYDRRLGHKLTAPCRDLLQEPHAVKVGRIRGLRGTVQEGDAQTASVVCVESRKVVVLVRASGDDNQPALGKRILDTLRFGE